MPVLIKDVPIREDAVNKLELNLFEAFFVTGHVIDREGAPAAGAEVRADWRQRAGRDIDRGKLDRSARRRTTGRTGDDGSFQLGPFEAGPKLTVFATSAESGSSNRHDVPAPFDGLVLPLRRHVIRGRVVDATTGEPVKSFQLRAHRNGRTHSTRHVDGYFEVPVDPETDSLHIEAPDRFPWFTRLFTSASTALRRSRTRGRWQAVRWCSAMANRSRASGLSSSRAGEWQGISDGLHTVETRTGHSVDVYVTEHATLDLELPAISLSGTVRADRTDRPLPGAG